MKLRIFAAIAALFSASVVTAQQTCTNTQVAITTAGVDQINGQRSTPICEDPVTGKLFINGILPGTGGGTTPLLASFTPVNLGTGTTAQRVVPGPIMLFTSNPTNSALLTIALPATPFKVQATLQWVAGTGGAWERVGLGFTDGTAANTVLIDELYAASLLRAETNTNSTLQNQSWSTPNHLVFFQVRDNGATLFFDYSSDGANYVNFYSEAIGTHGTPNAVGWSGGGNFLSVSLINWVVLPNATL